MQLAALTALRATTHHFISPDLHDGLFFYTLTDLQQNNIFVDENWNVQAIIDLEWARSVLIQMQLPPYWLTSRAIDQFDNDETVAEYDAVLEEYLAAEEAEEKPRNDSVAQATIKREVWKNGGFSFFNAVQVPRSMYNLFARHIQLLFNKEHAERRVLDDVVFWYWGIGAKEAIDGKIRDREEYLTKVRCAFAET